MCILYTHISQAAIAASSLDTLKSSPSAQKYFISLFFFFCSRAASIVCVCVCAFAFVFVFTIYCCIFNVLPWIKDKHFLRSYPFSRDYLLFYCALFCFFALIFPSFFLVRFVLSFLFACISNECGSVMFQLILSIFLCQQSFIHVSLCV